MSSDKPVTVDRRTTLKWVLAAAAAVPSLKGMAWQSAVAASSPASASAVGYGTDPDLQKFYSAGDLWPLTLSEQQRSTAAALCDAIIPADAQSPSASSVGVVDFIDEWMSAPYQRQREDRDMILAGFVWLDTEAIRRFASPFAKVATGQQAAICDDICYLPKARADVSDAAKFFARYRDLTAGGFYTTPAGNKDLQYIGNVPLAQFDGPPLAVLKAVGLA